MSEEGDLVRIVCTAGNCNSTRVYVGDRELHGVFAIKIDPILPDALLTATLTVHVAGLDVEAFAKTGDA